MTATTPLNETIGQRLYRLRHERGLSQQKLAEAGLSTAHISRIESGTRTPSVKALRLLARTLGVSTEYLETGSSVSASESLELRLADAEVQIRLGENLDEALATLETAYVEATQHGEPALISRALVDLGLMAASRDRYQEAAERLEQAAETGHIHPATHPDVFSTLARMYWLQDDYERCAALLESSLDRLGEYPPSETIVARTTFMTQLSYALSSLGDFDSARDLLVRVNEESEERTDPYHRARLYWSLARLSGIQGNLPAALNYVRRSITLLETTEDNIHLARAHLLCGQVFNLDESAEQAIVQLTQAERLFGERIDSIDLGHLRSEQSKALSTFGEAKQALAYAQEAVQRLDSDPDYLSSAWHALAKALALAGDIEEACRYYEQAVDQLEKSRSDWREAAQACHEWALILREAGRRDTSARAFGRAAEITRRQAKAASLGRTGARD